MSSFRYHVRYEFRGPTHDDPLATRPLSDDRLLTYLQTLCRELNALSSPDAGTWDAVIEGLTVNVVARDDGVKMHPDDRIAAVVRKMNLETTGLCLFIDPANGSAV